jgi:hypothetical protein
MAGQAPASNVVPEVQLPVAPWDGDNQSIYPAGQPSFIGWDTPTGYLPPYAPIIDFPSISSASRLCSTIGKSQCTTYSCHHGVEFGVAPYIVDQTARLALDVGSREFIKGLNLYQSCQRAVSGGLQAGPNVFI